MRRLVTALVLVPFVLYVIFAGPAWLFSLVVVVLAIVSFHEYANIAAGHNIRLPEWLGHSLGLVFMLIPWLDWRGAVLLMIVSLGWGLRADRPAETLAQGAALTMGVLYIYGTWRCAFFLRDHSPYWLLFALALNWVGDTAAYYAGRAFGRHKLAPAISPAKTVEGSVASTAAAIGFGVLLISRVFPEVPLWQTVALSAAASVAGQFGDLAESALKRGAGLKDSSQLLPGHGGWLDRLDSSLFSMPLVALYVSLPRG